MELSIIIWSVVFVVVAAATLFFIRFIFVKRSKTSFEQNRKSAYLNQFLEKKPRLFLGNIFSKSSNLNEIYSNLKDSLISSDVGLSLANKIIEHIKFAGPKTADEIKIQAKKQLLDILNSQNSASQSSNIKGQSSNIKGNNIKDNNIKGEKVKGEKGKLPVIYLFVGVNGVGKTTTLGKIAKKISLQNKKLIFAAADTFRAAAQDQLDTWAKAVGAKIVKGESQDPASVAYKAVDIAIKDGADMVFIDTAGRLHNKTNLLEELKKIVRVTEKIAPITQTFLVLDAMTGQNGLNQAKIFTQAVNVTGVILTKMDGTAKGGVIFSIQKELKVGVKYIGLGESPDDLVEFNAEQFVDSILN
ncbi:MAG: signal recognition particle-docking protein FtsY [Bifidobacteriaceae bacterium]|jgi:fused signal recognition particle receptor|nr:signal recognition particle-docking protein FtsY [Bifidobacteriaceae bacterium]